MSSPWQASEDFFEEEHNQQNKYGNALPKNFEEAMRSLDCRFGFRSEDDMEKFFSISEEYDEQRRKLQRDLLGFHVDKDVPEGYLRRTFGNSSSFQEFEIKEFVQGVFSMLK